MLREIYNSDYISKSSIAEKLDIPENLIEDAFFRLQGMGYIEEKGSISGCDYKCEGCAYANSCHSIPIKSIKITEKGKKLLNK